MTDEFSEVMDHIFKPAEFIVLTSTHNSGRDKVKNLTRNAKNQLHSINDQPSRLYENGSCDWHKNGKLHRENGPAVIDFDLDMNLYEEYQRNGRIHNPNGPAQIWYNGNTPEKISWWWQGSRMSFNQWAKKAKISDEKMAYLKLKWVGIEIELFPGDLT